MKIVQVIDQLELGGAERVCVNLTNLFHRNGHDVKLIVLRNKGKLFDLIDEGIEVIKLNKDKGKFKAYKEFKSLVKDIDIIHVHMRVNYRFVQKAFLFLGGRKPVIFHDHYGKIVVNQKVPKFYKSLFKPYFYIGCSELLTNWAINKVNVSKDKVFLVSNFVLKYASNYKEDFKPNGIVMVGSLKEVKNHKLAIDIAKKLNKSLTIYCPSVGGSYYDGLLEYIDSINYKEKVHFLTGYNNVQAELKQYELALLTSTSEGDPLALIEYIAQGIPFLCSNVGEAVKVVKKYLPDTVQNDFDVDNWITNYHKVKMIKSSDIENLYDKYFSSNIYLNKYITIYNQFLSLIK